MLFKGKKLKFIILVFISGTHHWMLSVNFNRDFMVLLALQFVAFQPVVQEILETHNNGK